MGEDEQKGKENPPEGGENQQDSAEALAKELGFASVEELKKKGKGLRKWEAEVNNEHQRVVRQPEPTPAPRPADDDDDPLEGVSPRVIKAIEKVVMNTVGPQLSRVQQDKAAEMSEVVQDFLDDHPDVTQKELFDTMNDEELWPEEDRVTKRLLRRRLNSALRFMTEDPDEESLREKYRKEILEEMKDSDSKVINVKPVRKGGDEKIEKPSNWFSRMQDEMNS